MEQKMIDDKQIIEEMAKVISGTEKIARDAHCGYPSPRMYATDLFYKGWRKQNEGEWIKPTSFSKEFCSECRLTPKMLLGLLPKYCPNCGAKMKGGAE